MKCGYHQNPWLNNCVSIGLATGFVEPLESTGIMLILKGIGGFVWHLNNSDNEPVKSNIETYNKNMLWTINGIIDFIQAHFVLTSREDTSYWKHVKYSTPIREELRKILDKMKLNGTEDSSGQFFPPTSWRCILSGMQADVSSQYRYVKKVIYET
jgi:tryptophan halogenase